MYTYICIYIYLVDLENRWGRVLNLVSVMFFGRRLNVFTIVFTRTLLFQTNAFSTFPLPLFTRSLLFPDKRFVFGFVTVFYT